MLYKGKPRKQFVQYFVGLLLVFLTTTATFVIWYDPQMCFSAVRPSNRIIPIIDSRLQKTNRLLQKVKTYDALLLGSSRVEQFRQQDFAPRCVFNYAMVSFYPDEAEEYLDFFLRNNGGIQPIVFFGLDFFSSNQRAYGHAKSPRHYIETCVAPAYAYKSILNKDMLKYSYHIAKGVRELTMYDRVTLDKPTRTLSKEDSRNLLRKQLEIYERTFYGDYRYNEKYATVLRELKQRHRELKIIPFTTPISRELFELLIKTGRLPDYERWLRDIVAVFGSVQHFMVIDRLTSDQGTFVDSHHAYPEKLAPLARIISGRPLPEDADIGQLIDAGNIEAHLATVREQAKRINLEKRP